MGNVLGGAGSWSDDFTRDSGFDRARWPAVWGAADDFSWGKKGLTITSYKSEGWGNAGFIQPDWSPGLSQGYGTYWATASAPANQGIGIAILMWPADNVWPGPEIDLLENGFDPTGKSGYATIHWKGAAGQDEYDVHNYSVDLSKTHTYSMDWERGSLSFSIDDKQVFRVTGSEVPNDFADGGVNAAFGAEVTAAGTGPQPGNTVSLTIAAMGYLAPVASKSLPATAAATASAVVATRMDLAAAGTPPQPAGPPPGADEAPQKLPEHPQEPAAAAVVPSAAVWSTVVPKAAEAVYRLSDKATGFQFLTSSTSERDDVLRSHPGFVDQGMAFRPAVAVTDPVTVSRFFDTTNGSHFYTASAAERDSVAATRPDLIQEGSGFVQQSTAAPGFDAVYRMFDPVNGGHSYAGGATERASILTARPDLVQEGIAFYAAA